MSETHAGSLLNGLTFGSAAKTGVEALTMASPLGKPLERIGEVENIGGALFHGVKAVIDWMKGDEKRALQEAEKGIEDAGLGAARGKLANASPWKRALGEVGMEAAKGFLDPRIKSGELLAGFTGRHSNELPPVRGASDCDKGFSHDA